MQEYCAFTLARRRRVSQSTGTQSVSNWLEAESYLGHVPSLNNGSRMTFLPLLQGVHGKEFTCGTACREGKHGEVHSPTWREYRTQNGDFFIFLFLCTNYPFVEHKISILGQAQPKGKKQKGTNKKYESKKFVTWVSPNKKWWRVVDVQVL